MGIVLGILFLALIVGARSWRRATYGLPRTYYVPASAPGSDESIEAYDRRMSGVDRPESATLKRLRILNTYRSAESEADHAMDDAEFTERHYRKPFCTLRLNGSESLDALAEKEGYGGRDQ